MAPLSAEPSPPITPHMNPSTTHAHPHPRPAQRLRQNQRQRYDIQHPPNVQHPPRHWPRGPRDYYHMNHPYAVNNPHTMANPFTIQQQPQPQLYTGNGIMAGHPGYEMAGPGQPFGGMRAYPGYPGYEMPGPNQPYGMMGGGHGHPVYPIPGSGLPYGVNGMSPAVLQNGFVPPNYPIQPFGPMTGQGPQAYAMPSPQGPPMPGNGFNHQDVMKAEASDQQMVQYNANQRRAHGRSSSEDVGSQREEPSQEMGTDGETAVESPTMVSSAIGTPDTRQEPTPAISDPKPKKKRRNKHTRSQQEPTTPDLQFYGMPSTNSGLGHDHGPNQWLPFQNESSSANQWLTSQNEPSSSAQPQQSHTRFPRNLNAPITKHLTASHRREASRLASLHDQDPDQIFKSPEVENLQRNQRRFQRPDQSDDVHDAFMGPLRIPSPVLPRPEKATGADDGTQNGGPGGTGEAQLKEGRRSVSESHAIPMPFVKKAEKVSHAIPIRRPSQSMG
ncbi:hypothetical protein VTL71DRAFT_1242 [Oculimacula yallundae]|uniref:Uncharacterized protein n=1 Tax=Oculimacula yallundae TaxID=86028 RepID=A0ABR4CCE9_9HELO